MCTWTSQNWKYWRKSLIRGFCLWFTHFMKQKDKLDETFRDPESKWLKSNFMLIFLSKYELICFLHEILLTSEITFFYVCFFLYNITKTIFQKFIFKKKFLRGKTVFSYNDIVIIVIVIIFSTSSHTLDFRDIVCCCLFHHINVISHYVYFWLCLFTMSFVVFLFYSLWLIIFIIFLTWLSFNFCLF